MRGLTILQGIMMLLLLAVCGNTANLVLARASARYREIGVRLALGATPRRVVLEIMREGLGVIVKGALAGWLVALGIYIHAVPGGAISLSTFLGVPAILMLVATFACWLPAQRVAALDPVGALRQE